MATIAKSVTSKVTSGAAQANGKPVYIGGQNFTWHIEAPAALGEIQVSNDKANWVATAVTSQGDGVGQITTRPLWARFVVAIDGSAPRTFTCWFAVAQENG